jgi:hypothetical protein
VADETNVLLGAGAIVVEFFYDGEYAKVKVRLDGLEGVGTSRVQAKALSYALEDLAVKVRNGG